MACALCQLAVTAGVNPWWGIGWTMAFAGFKEWGWDMVREPDTALGSLLDFSFYALGCAVSVAVFWLCGRV